VVFLRSEIERYIYKLQKKMKKGKDIKESPHLRINYEKEGGK
jgi:hypothetical protein